MPFAKGNQFGGRRSARKSEIIRSPTPVQQDASDEEMVDVDAEETNGATPLGDEVEDAEEGEEDDDDGDSPPHITTIPRRTRGRGRGRGRSSRHDIGTPEAGEEGSESGTPVRRRRGRPPGPNSGRGGGRGGFRGRNRKQVQDQPRVVDKEGNTLDVVDDEAVVDFDDEGNEKVDALGNLQGGREYRVRTFTIIGRGERLYMLSTEPARCCGFRDSYLFFTKHPKLYKVLVNEEEKKDLIDRDILPNSYKGRNIGVVTARSVFREFGARIIVGGKRVIDDYKVTEARENGEVEGELADPEDRLPENKEEYNRNRYVAWFGASEVYRNQGQGGGAVHPGKPGTTAKRRNNNMTVGNWQFAHAREASRFNSALTALRHANLDGVYDTHTNMMFYPQVMQPTHARWEQIPPPSIETDSDHKLLTNGTTDGTSISQPSSPTMFTPVPAVVSRNFTVVDTAFSAPPLTTGGYPGPDGAIQDSASGSTGLDSIPDDIVAELPEDCRREFERAREEERKWKGQWGSEVMSGCRPGGGLKVGLMGWPV